MISYITTTLTVALDTFFLVVFAQDISFDVFVETRVQNTVARNFGQIARREFPHLKKVFKVNS